MMSVNEKNIALIELSNLKFEGTGSESLLDAVVSAFREGSFLNNDNPNNATQIRFAQAVWNNCDVATRVFLRPSGNEEFLSLASESEMTPIISAALDSFNANAVQGDASKRADYEQIVIKYQAAKAKQAAESVWTEQLTPGEQRLIDKFESREAVARDNHFPNENAVTYVWLLAKVMKMAGFKQTEVSKLLVDKTNDLLDFVELHGDKTTHRMLQVINKYETIPGRRSRVDIKPYLKALTEHPEYVTGTEANDDNRLTSNTKVTTKRLYRMVHIFKPNSQTPWGILNLQGEEFVDAIVKLYNAESAVELPDKKSLAIIWYLCIGRKHMSCVMVDHHELSGANVLMEILGTQPQSAFPMPNHVFDFEHPLAADM